MYIGFKKILLLSSITFFLSAMESEKNATFVHVITDIAEICQPKYFQGKKWGTGYDGLYYSIELISFDTTIKDIKQYLQQEKLIIDITKPMYVSYKRTYNSPINPNGYKTIWKFKEVSDSTHVIGITERYKEFFLTPFLLPIDKGATSYQK